METTENKPTENQLPLEGQIPPTAGDQAQPSSPAAAEKAAAEKGPARKAGDRTAARAPKKGSAAKSGARPRRLKADARPEPAPTNVHLVMLTSRVSDVEGRFVARRRLVLATEDRAGDLIVRGQAREATADEIKSASADLPKIR